MAFFCRLLFWAFVLHIYTPLTCESTSPANPFPFQDKQLKCRHKIRVYLASYTWTTQMGGGKAPNYKIQDQFLVALMGKISNSAKVSGLNCTFDKSSYVLTCCDDENLDLSHLLDIKDLTPLEKFWNYDMRHLNVVFVLVNCLLFMATLSWALMVSMSYTPDEPDDESIQTIETPIYSEPLCTSV